MNALNASCYQMMLWIHHPCIMMIMMMVVVVAGGAVVGLTCGLLRTTAQFNVQTDQELEINMATVLT